MPSPHSGESSKAYMKRAMPEIYAHAKVRYPGKSPAELDKIATAIAFSMYRESKKKGKKS